jgi:serine/threonine protein kinase
VSENQNLVGGYELKNCIATGNSTQIWEVTQQGGTLPLAMKLLLREAHKDAQEKAVLKHEFKIGSSLDHPNFLRFHQMEVNRDHGFFVMDYFRAPSLKTQMAGNRPQTQSRFQKIADALCQAFAYLHEKGWLHRDIKPENILVNKAGEVRVIDFNLTCRIGGLFGGKNKVIKGTRTYIAPETILKKKQTIQTDIYSLGVTLYELVTGVPPFAGLSPNDLLAKHLSEQPAPPSAENPNVAPELDQVLLRLLAKKPKDRPADMREVQAALRSVRCFVEDPYELHERRVREAKEKESLSVDKRLDSRADHDRVSRGLAAPVKHVNKKKGKTASMEALSEVKKKSSDASQQPAAPVPHMPYGMPQPMPGMMMPPQQQMPFPMPHPGMMPHMPMQMPHPAPQMPPGPHPMQQPGGTQPVPPQPVPPQQVPQQQPPAQQQPAQQPPAQQQPAPVRLPLERPVPPPMPENPEADDDLDYMTELPDIA